MCNLYSISTNQAAITALFRRMNRYVGNLQPMPGIFPDGALDPQRRRRRGDGADAVGHAAPTQDRRAAGHQHPQYLVAALAQLAETGESLPGAGQQLRRVRAGAESRNEEEGRHLVRARQQSAAVLLRRHLDGVQGRPAGQRSRCAEP